MICHVHDTDWELLISKEIRKGFWRSILVIARAVRIGKTSFSGSWNGTAFGMSRGMQALAFNYSQVYRATIERLEYFELFERED